MKAIIKKTIFLFFILAQFFSFGLAMAEENKEGGQISIEYFWQEGCPHCTEAKPFLEKMAKKYPEINISSIEVLDSGEGKEIFFQRIKDHNIEVPRVPLIIIGNKYFAGFYDENLTGVEIENQIKIVLGIDDVDKRKKINIPLIGEIDIANFSLPIITIVIGAIDGFNPCAMWALIFLITLLFGMKDRKKMWILGTIFILVSAIIYFGFMMAWLNLFIFIGLMFWVRIIIGGVALAGGVYSLKDYFSNPKGVCKTIGDDRKTKTFDKLKKIVSKKGLFLSILGIIALSFSVNLVELICSAGLPAVYTHILTMAGLASWKYYLYLALYILVFMLDDLIVFIVAMITLRITGATTKYNRIARLIGGILMIIIGLLLVFKPDLLLFG